MCIISYVSPLSDIRVTNLSNVDLCVGKGMAYSFHTIKCFVFLIKGIIRFGLGGYSLKERFLAYPRSGRWLKSGMWDVGVKCVPAKWPMSHYLTFVVAGKLCLDEYTAGQWDLRGCL